MTKQVFTGKWRNLGKGEAREDHGHGKQLGREADTYTEQSEEYGDARKQKMRTKGSTENETIKERRNDKIINS